MRQHFDILIIGSGMIGAALASSLKSYGFKIGIIDKKPISELKSSIKPSLRVSAINPQAQQLLEKLGAWQLIPEDKKAKYTSLEVWDFLTNNHILFNKNNLCFNAHDVSYDFLGYIIENNQIQNSILQTLKNHTGVSILEPAEINALTTNSTTASITTSNNDILTADLVIGADGAESFVRKAAGLGFNKIEYKQHCFVATVELEEPAGLTTWQQFDYESTTAFLPLASSNNKHYASLVWHTTALRVNELKVATKKQQLAEIINYFPARLPAIKTILQTGGFPLAKAHALRYCTNNIALVGDAAHLIHPLAGQGANLGFQDVSCLADIIVAAKAQQDNIGDINILRQYEQKRFINNYAINSFIHYIYLTFNSNNIITKQLRNFGVSLLNKIPIAKNIATYCASGKNWDINFLSRICKCRDK